MQDKIYETQSKRTKSCTCTTKLQWKEKLFLPIQLAMSSVRIQDARFIKTVGAWRAQIDYNLHANIFRLSRGVTRSIIIVKEKCRVISHSNLRKTKIQKVSFWKFMAKFSHLALCRVQLSTFSCIIHCSSLLSLDDSPNKLLFRLIKGRRLNKKCLTDRVEVKVKIVATWLPFTEITAKDMCQVIIIAFYNTQKTVTATPDSHDHINEKLIHISIKKNFDSHNHKQSCCQSFPFLSSRLKVFGKS